MFLVTVSRWGGGDDWGEYRATVSQRRGRGFSGRGSSGAVLGRWGHGVHVGVGGWVSPRRSPGVLDGTVTVITDMRQGLACAAHCACIADLIAPLP